MATVSQLTCDCCGASKKIAGVPTTQNGLPKGWVLATGGTGYDYPTRSEVCSTGCLEALKHAYTEAEKVSSRVRYLMHKEALRCVLPSGRPVPSGWVQEVERMITEKNRMHLVRAAEHSVKLQADAKAMAEAEK